MNHDSRYWLMPHPEQHTKRENQPFLDHLLARVSMDLCVSSAVGADTVHVPELRGQYVQQHLCTGPPILRNVVYLQCRMVLVHLLKGYKDKTRRCIPSILTLVAPLSKRE